MIKTNSIKATYIGQELPELTPVEIVGRTMSSGHRLCADRSGSVETRLMKQEAHWLRQWVVHDGKTQIIVNVLKGIKHIYCQKKHGTCICLFAE